MKTKKLFAAIVLLLAGTTTCTQVDLDNQYFKQSEYKITRELRYSSSTSTEPSGSTEYLYNSASDLKKKSFYDCYLDNVILWTYKTYEYSDGKLILEKIFDGEVGHLTLGLYMKYYYSGENLIKEETYRGYDNSFVISMNYEYENNNKVRSYNFEPQYGISRDMKYEYDNQNRLILEESTAIDATDIKYTKYFYDDKSREVKIEYFNPNWEILQSAQKKYEGNNLNPYREILYNKNGKEIRVLNNTLDSWGNITKSMTADGCVLFKRKYTGELLEESIYYYGYEWQCSEGGMIRYVYEKL